MQEVKSMREEYDIEKLNPRKNPYSRRLKKQITINIDSDTVDFSNFSFMYQYKNTRIYFISFDSPTKH